MATAEPREKVQIMGEYSDAPLEIAVNADGAIKTDIEVDVSSGLNVFISGAVVNISGQPVTISGGHVFVESGVYLASGIHVVADVDVSSGLHVVVESGLGVQVESGAHVVAAISVDSGLNVVVESGLGVQVESGVYLASGAHVVADIAESGLGVQIQSGASVVVQSGLQTIVESGLNVQVESGIYIASGIHVVTEMEVTVDISGDAVSVSGQPVMVSSGQISILSGEVISKISGESVMLTDRSGLFADMFIDNSLRVAQAKTNVEPWDSTAGIITSPDITNLNLSTNHRGKGRYSVEFDKTGVTQAYAMISKPIIPGINISCYSTHAWLFYHLYLADLSDVTVVYTVLGTDSGNLWYWQTGVSDLNAGWNHIHHHMSTVDGELGTGCRLEDVSWIATYVGFGAAADTLNNIRVDDCIVKRSFELGKYSFNVTSGEIHVMSGSMIVESGNITVDSGLNVVVESGVGVLISGQHVHVESGDNIDTYIHGYYHDSGDWRPLAVDASGQIDIAVEVSSGLHVNISGTPVTISGDHVYVESGVYLASGLYVASGVGVLVDATDTSGQVVHIGCSDTIRTADFVRVIGGSSGYIGGSGGVSICASGRWCSGLVHTVTVKNMDGNEDMFIGGSECKPYSGHGYVLGGNETHTFDICNPCLVYVAAVLSGEMITWIGTDY